MLKFELENKFDNLMTKREKITKSITMGVILLISAFVVPAIFFEDGIDLIPLVPFYILLAFSASYFVRSIAQVTGVDVVYNNMSNKKKILLFTLGLMVIWGIVRFIVPLVEFSPLLPFV